MRMLTVHVGVALLLVPAARQAQAQSMPASAEPHPVFTSPIVTSIASKLDVDFADVQGDGRDDFVATTIDGQLTRAFGLGQGTFSPEQVLPGTVGYQAVALGDFDGDGTPDLVGGATGAGAFLNVALGNGTGGFGAPMSSSLAGTIGTLLLAPGDADGDGDLDVAISAVTGGLPVMSYVALCINDGTGALQPEVLAPALDYGNHLPRTADFNGDGVGDLLASGGSTQPFHVFLGQPGGGFTDSGSLPTGWHPTPASCIADLDEDGVADLVLGTSAGYETWLGIGDGSFQFLQAQSVPGFSATFIDAGDIDGDGHLDLVTFAFTQGDLYVMKGAGDGTTTLWKGATAVHEPHVLDEPSIVDLDGDGRDDIACGRNLYQGASTQVVTLRNITYPPGGPLADWGGAMQGSIGYPVLVASGSFVAGSPFELGLYLAKPGGKAWLVGGLDAVFLPMKGGVLVPEPAFVTGPLGIDAKGAADLGGLWPAGLPAGTTLNLQFWFKDISWIGFAASSSVHIVQP